MLPPYQHSEAATHQLIKKVFKSASDKTPEQVTITHTISEETKIIPPAERQALKDKKRHESTLVIRDEIYRVLYESLEAKCPPEIINRIYDCLVWAEVERIAKIYHMRDTSTPQEILEAAGKSSVGHRHVAALVRAGAQAYSVTSDGLSLLDHAVKRKDEKLVTQLLRAGASYDDPQWDGWEHLKAAINTGAADKAKDIFTTYEEVRGVLPKTHPLRNAIVAGDMIAAQECIKYDDKANGISESDEESLLCFAVRQGHAPTVKVLLDHGANPHDITCFGGSLVNVSRNSEIKEILQDAIALRAHLLST